MSRRFLLTFALTGLLSLAFATPSQADFVYDLTGSFSVTGGTATDVEMLLSPTNASITLDSISGFPAASGSITTVDFFGTNYPAVTLTFAPTASAAYVVQITSDVQLHLQSYFLTGLTNSVTASSINVLLTPASVPEPASLALLGIGMTGFLAFRRFFKKTSVA